MKTQIGKKSHKGGEEFIIICRLQGLQGSNASLSARLFFFKKEDPLLAGEGPFIHNLICVHGADGACMISVTA